MQVFHLSIGKTGGSEFGIYAFESDFVEFVDGHGDVDDAVGRPDDLGDAAEDFAVVEFDGHAYAEPAEHFVSDEQELHLIEQRVGAHDVSVALVEFAVSAALRTVCTPYGLYLIAFEGELQFVAVLHDVTCKGYGEVVAETLFAELCRELRCGSLLVELGGDATCEVAGVENLEKEFVALLAIFAHECGEVLHRWGFNLSVAVETEDGAYGVEDIVAACHFERSEIACAFRYTGFLCHYCLLMWVLRENGFAIYSWLELLDEIDLCGQVVGISVQPYASGMCA